MVSLLFREFAHPINEGESGFEVGKLQSADNVMLIHNLPPCGIGQLLMEGGEVISF